MKKAEFESLFTYCKTATTNDCVWWQGYLFLGLTEKQANKLGKLLFNRGFAYKFNKGEFHTEIIMPSGISIKAMI